MTHRFRILAALLNLFLLLPTQAQWRTETHNLKAGWNAIYLLVDTGNEKISDILFGREDIQELWRWNPKALDPSILESPDEPVEGKEWTVWRRNGPSDLAEFSPNAAYLVKLAPGAPNQELPIKGKALAPEVTWRSDGLNLVGFPTAGESPLIRDYLKSSTTVEDLSAIHEYVGGPLVAGSNPVQLRPNLDRFVRGRAYWVRTRKYSDFYGPLRVDVALLDGLHFGASGRTVRLVLTNRSEGALTATLTPTPSETAPGGAGQPAQVPLLRRIFNDETSAFEFVPFGAAHTVELAPGATSGLTVSVDRSQIGDGGALASLLKVTDSGGLSEVYLPATAEVQSDGRVGLWVGQARVTHVQNHLQNFQKAEEEYELDEDGERALVSEPYELDEDGKRILVSEDTGINNAAQEFPLRLILHSDGTNLRFLSQVYHGVIGVEGDETLVFGSTIDPSALDDGHIGSAFRISAAHLPPGLDAPLDGALQPGAALTTAQRVEIGKNHLHNPFLHTYHPDHDNLGRRFEVGPEDSETPNIRRAISMTLDARPGVVADPAWGTTLLTGKYTEVIEGLHKNTIQVEGVFAIRRITEEPRWQN